MVGGSAMLFLVSLEEKTGTPKFHFPEHGEQWGRAHSSPCQACSYPAGAFLCAPVTAAAPALHHFRELGKTPRAQQPCLVPMHSSALLQERWLIPVSVGEVLLQFHHWFNILSSTDRWDESEARDLSWSCEGQLWTHIPQEMLELLLLPLAGLDIWWQLAPGKWWSGSVSSALWENHIFFCAQWLFPQCFWVDSLLKALESVATSVENTFRRLQCHVILLRKQRHFQLSSVV